MCWLEAKIEQSIVLLASARDLVGFIGNKYQTTKYLLYPR